MMSPPLIPNLAHLAKENAESQFLVGGLQPLGTQAIATYRASIVILPSVSGLQWKRFA